MKRLILLPVIAASLLLGACSTVGSRINEKGSVFYSLDDQTRAKIAHGDVGIGFTPDMVYIALGKPDAKRFRTATDGATETWVYGGYYYDNVAYAGYHRWGGWGRGGYYRMYWEPVYSPYYGPAGGETRVTFRGGKVVAIDQAA